MPTRDSETAFVGNAIAEPGLGTAAAGWRYVRGIPQTNDGNAVARSRPERSSQPVGEVCSGGVQSARRLQFALMGMCKPALDARHVRAVEGGAVCERLLRLLRPVPSGPAPRAGNRNGSRRLGTRQRHARATFLRSSARPVPLRSVRVRPSTRPALIMPGGRSGPGGGSSGRRPVMETTPRWREQQCGPPAQSSRSGDGETKANLIQSPADDAEVLPSSVHRPRTGSA